MTHYQPVNPHLSAAHYSLTAFDSQQSDSFPYPVAPGRFEVDLLTLPRVLGGPVNITCLASARPGRMWAMGTDRVTLVDVSDGRFEPLASLPLPGVDPIPDESLARLAATELESVEQTEAMARELFGAHPEQRTSNGLYTVADGDDVVYVNAGSVIHAITVADPDDPSAGLVVLRSLDTTEFFTPFQLPGAEPMVKLIGMNLTYDGHLVLGGFGQMAVVDRTFSMQPHVHEFPAGQLLSNSFSVDADGGIYVATGSLMPRGAGLMHKLVWTGSTLSTDPADGAWCAEYPGGDWAPAVKFGTGTGSTPTLMGFGPDDDQLVIITDGQNRMRLTAFWRNDLPAGVTDRIADAIAVTCGLGDEVAWIQSEQSVATLDRGALVVNNVTPEGQSDRLIDVLVSGPLVRPAFGVERFEWDPSVHRWASVWTRDDLASISQVPVISQASRMALVNTFGSEDGWEVTGVDWETGRTVHRTVFGKVTAGNGAYALVQMLPGGDMIFTSIAGPVRVPLSSAVPSSL
jgi:hypothetical protein